jgi:small subunit ribosomal protein S8
MLSRLRNATIARHTRVDMPSSRLKVEIAKILESEGYIQGFKVVDAQPGERPQAHLRVFLKSGPRGSSSAARTMVRRTARGAAANEAAPEEAAALSSAAKCAGY